MGFNSGFKGLKTKKKLAAVFDSLYRYNVYCELLGVLAKLRKATISFVMSVRPSARLPVFLSVSVRLPVRPHGKIRVPLTGFS
jgi:hypothetical protein